MSEIRTVGVLGCGLAYLGFELLPRVAGALGPLALAMTLSPRIVAYSFLIAALIGAVSGFIPRAWVEPAFWAWLGGSVLCLGWIGDSASKKSVDGLLVTAKQLG